MKPVSQCLEEGAEILLKRGKCEGALQNFEGQVCAMGAFNLAHHGHPMFAWGLVGNANNYTPYGHFIKGLDSHNLAFFNNGDFSQTPTARETADRMIELAKEYRNRGE